MSVLPAPGIEEPLLASLRILVVDDHDVIRHGLRSLLEAQPQWHICAEAVDGREAIEKARELKPDVIIMDVNMPNVDGLEATKRIHQEQPQVPILILTLHDSEEMTYQARAAGAQGYIRKSDSERELVSAVRAVSKHQSFFPASHRS